MKLSKEEVVYDPFFVMFGEPMWTLLYAADKVTAIENTIAYIEQHL
jgi:hypothetical protein